MIFFVYDMLHILPLALAALLIFFGYTGAESVSFSMCVSGLLPAVLLTLFRHLQAKGRLLLSGLVLMGGVWAVVLYRLFADRLELSDPAMFLPFALLSAVAFLLGSLTARYMAFRLITPLCGAVLLILIMTGHIQAASGAVFGILGEILLCLVTQIQKHWKKAGDTDIKAHLVFCAPFLALVILPAALIRYPDKPYDWQAFLNIYHRLEDAAGRIAFSFGNGTDLATGFTEEGTLGTRVTEKSTDVFLLTTSSDQRTCFYLTGLYFDTFDGQSWTRTDTYGYPMRAMDAAESISAVTASGGVLGDYYREIHLTLQYQNTKSRYFFAPSKLTSKGSLPPKLTLSETGAVLSFNRLSPYHLLLTESYLKPNGDHPGFYDFMQDPSIPDETSWNDALRYLKGDSSGADQTYADYLRYREHIRTVFASPVVLSDALRTKMDLLYEGAQSDYEKMKRLELALQDLTYTTEPPAIPASVTDPSGFLDFFLLDSETGYCTYFATAFVLLARAEGLPARYAQGYRAEIPRKGTYYITSLMAHAWPEVYFEGKGWIGFEPTPGFYREMSWAMADRSASEGAPSPRPEQVFGEEEKTAEEIPEEAKPEESPFFTPELLRLMALLFAFTAAFLAVLLSIGKAVSRRRFERMDRTGRLRYLSADCLGILRLLGLPLQKGETLSEYAGRISPLIGKEATAFIPLYEMVLYGDPDRLPSSLSAAFDSRERLMQQLKRKRRGRYLLKVLLS